MTPFPNATTGAQGTLGPVYTYTDAGRLKTRTWQRGTVTTYSYKYTIPGSVEICVPELQSIDYSDTTPDVTYTHNRLGQLKTAVRAGMTATYSRNLIGQVKDEAFSGGTLSGLAVKHDYDAPTRLTTLRLVDGTTTLLNTGYVYDTSSRLDQGTDNLANSHFAKYAYSDNSRLVSMVRMTNNASGEGSRTDRAWDKNNRLTGISSRSFLNAVDTGTVISREYGYNVANQRIAAYCEDGTYWVYNYDSLGQVTSGRKYWADGSEVAGQQFEYRFDDIGNRDTTGGRASAVSDYSANQLNQISTKTTPTKVDVIGVATASSGVDVWKNSDTAISASRKGEYFHAALNVVNSTYPAIKAKSLASGSSAIDAGKSFVPIATEAFTYDDDGNQTADGRWNAYAWDGENRLKEMRRGAANPASPQVGEPTTPSDSLMRLLFEYDYLGRRIRKTVQTITGSAWVTSKDTIYLYDEWNVIAELSTAKVIRRSYAWGTDLSGSMYGAGGVGGLLWVRNHESAAGPVAHAFTSYDGNGNVMGLFSALDGSALARYEYGPFGEAIQSLGSLSSANAIRWSSKYIDSETGLSYYGYRYYDSRTGRWPNRDPIEEKGGANLYAFVRNGPANAVDPYGKESWIPTTDPRQGNPAATPDPTATKYQWSAPSCGAGMRTAFIQVGFGGSVRKPSPFVDDGKHGQGSDKPKCPPLYPGANGNWFEDSPSTALGTGNPLLYGLKFTVCRVCLSDCCPGRVKISSIGPCKSYTLGPGTPLTVDLGELPDEQESADFRSILSSRYPKAPTGGCFKCEEP